MFQSAREFSFPITSKIDKVAFYEMCISPNAGTRHLVSIDPSIKNILNVEPQVILDDVMALYSLVFAEDVEIISQYEREAYENGKPFAVQFRSHVLGEETLKTLQVFSSCHHSDETGQQFWKGVVVDVTDVVDKQQELISLLSSHEEVFENTFEHAAIGIVHVSVDGKILRTNKQFEKFLEADSAYLKGKKFHEITHPDDAQKSIELVKGMLMGTQPDQIHMRKRYLKPSGEVIWGNLMTALIRDEQQHPKYFIAVVEDLTETLVLENELNQQKIQLRNLIDHAGVWLASFDQDIRYIHANRKYSESFGKPVEAIEGHLAAEILPQAIFDMHLPLVKKCLSGKKVPFDSEVEINGQPVFSTGQYIPIRDEQTGEVVSGMVSVSDVTEKMAVLKSLKRSEATFRAISDSLTILFDENADLSTLQSLITKVGQAVNVSRSYIFEAVKDHGDYIVTQKYEWTADGVDSQLDNPDTIALPLIEAGLERWFVELSQGHILNDKVSELSQPERELLEPQDIKVIIVAPIFVDGKWWGFLGFDDCESEHPWSDLEIDTLNVCAKAIGSAISFYQLNAAKKQAELEVRLSETRLRESLEAAEHGVWDWDMLTNEVYYSPIWKSMLGYKMDELGTGLEEFESRVHPDDVAHVWQLIHEHIEGQTEGFKAEFRMLGKMGEWVWVLAHGRVTRRDSSGKPVRLAGTHTDITPFKIAENQLKESEENFRQLFEKNKAVQIILESETGQIINANEAAIEFYGYSFEQICEMNISQINTLDTDEIHNEMTRAHQESRAHFFFKHRLCSGEIRDVEMHSGPVIYNGKQCLYSIIHDVTREKELETELENERILMHSLINGIPDLVWMKDKEGVYLSVNKRFEEFFGAKTQEILGKTDYDFVDEKLADFFREHDVIAMNKGGPSINEEEIAFASDGHKEVLETIKTPVVDVDNNLLGVLGVGRDITDRKKLENKLIQERNLFASGPVIVSAFSAEDNPKVDFISTNCEAILGYSAEEFISGKMAFFDLVSKEDAAKIRHSLKTHIQNKTDTWESTYQITRKDGEQRWLYDVVASEKNDKGEIFGFRSYRVDITDQKLAETEANKLSMVAQKTGNAVIVTDASGKIDWVNDAFTKISGYQLSEVLGQKPGDFLQGELSDPNTIRFMSDRLAHQQGFVTEIINYTKTGEDYWLNLEVQPVFDENQKLINFIAIETDITELKRNQESLLLAASVYQNAHDGILICDADKNIIDVNPMFEEISGYSKENVIGKNPRILASGRQQEDFYFTMWADINSKGYWRGELWNRRKNGELYTIQANISIIKDANGEITHYLSIFSDISQLKRHQEQLERLAHFDPLTQLPNRTLLSDRLTQAISHADRTNTFLAVCFLDLDNFKPVNDTYGHNIGDQLLVELSRKMVQYLRGEDTIARLGGDEFILLLRDLRDISDLEQMANKLLAIVSQEITLSQYRIQLSGSLGVTVYPQDSADADGLIRHADQAMYEAKLQGRDRYHIFDTVADERSYQKHQSLSRIKQGLEDAEFELYYQPQINTNEGVMLGFEALVRWNHPETGLVYPNTFIPFMDGHSLSTELDIWVVESAISQLSIWRQKGFNSKISVNITGDSLLKHSFVKYLQELLTVFPDVEPNQIEVEVLETSTLTDVDTTRLHLSRIREMGISVALDDFGTGYSSLTYLRSLPADTLKIDRSFISDMLKDESDKAIVDGVIQLAKVFGLQVIAEGVEDALTASILAKMGCHNIQGYWVSKPVNIEMTELLIRNWEQKKSDFMMKSTP